jgi:vancomycin resistance protein YoaR
VYPGQQNMKFVNDTGNYILVQAHTEGNDATVSLYGTPDGRIVAMEGPYFTTNAPEGFLENESVLRKNEIGWMQKVSMADGTKRDKVLVARYKSLPKSVVKKYTSDTIARLDTNVSHGAAGQ